MQQRHKTNLTIAAAAVAAIAVIIATTLIMRHNRKPERRLQPLPAPAATASSPSPTPAVTVDNDTWASWTLLHNGQTITGGDPGESSTESLIKIAIAADYLNSTEPDAHALDLLTRMIRNSDDGAAQELYETRGRDAVIQRLLYACPLHHTTITTGWWSKTHMDTTDAAQLGKCLADNRLTSARWTAWILDQMRNIQGEGRFGAVAVRPTDHGTPLAIKNGWTQREDGTWHVNCLAVTATWSLAVMTRYPAARGLSYGADLCARVAHTVLPSDREPPRPGGRFE